MTYDFRDASDDHLSAMVAVLNTQIGTLTNQKRAVLAEMGRRVVEQAKADGLIPNDAAFTRLCKRLFKLTDENAHTEAVLRLVQAYPCTAHLVADMKKAFDKQMATGHLTKDVADAREHAAMEAYRILEQHMDAAMYQRLLASM